MAVLSGNVWREIDIDNRQHIGDIGQKPNSSQINLAELQEQPNS